MLLHALFIVFMVLAFASTFPGTRIPGSGLFLWISVLILYFMWHGVGI